EKYSLLQAGYSCSHVSRSSQATPRRREVFPWNKQWEETSPLSLHRTCPIWWTSIKKPTSVNQRLPSGPTVMIVGKLLAVGTGNSVIAPAVVMRPIWLPRRSLNQRLPSGPTVMPTSELLAVGTANSLTTPAVVIRPIWFPADSVNQRLPSGPAVMP